MEVSRSVYEWLSGIPELELPEQDESPTLSEDLLETLEQGESFGTILKFVLEKAGRTSLPSFKSGQTPSERLHNWNAIVRVLSSLGVNVSHDTKSLIVAGDKEALVGVLSQLHTAATQAPSPPPPEGGVFVDDFDEAKPLFEADSCLEFLLLSFCHHFKLTIKQAAGLLTRGNRYLALIVVKGLKSDYEPVVEWLQDVYTNAERLVELVTRESSSLTFVLNAFKPGFISKAPEVVEWTFRLLSKVFLEFSDSGLLEAGWTWFISEAQSPLVLTMHALKRIGERLQLHTVELLLQTGHSFEVFGRRLLNTVGDEEYATLMTSFLPVLLESGTASEELKSNGLVEFWLEHGLKLAENPSVSLRVQGLHFLKLLVTTFFDSVQMNLTNNVLALVNKVCRDEHKLLRVQAIVLMFEFLDFFQNVKSPFAGITFRALTFLYMEAFERTEDREFLANHFKQVVDSSGSVPIGILLEPLLIRIQMTSFEWNVCDFDLFLAIAEHPKLTLKHALQLIDVAGKTYFLDPVYARLSGVLLTHLAAKFLDTEPMQQYLQLFGTRAIEAVQTASIAIATARKYTKTAEHKQQRIVAMEMLTWIAQQWERPINKHLLTAVFAANAAFKEACEVDCSAFTELQKILTDIELDLPSEEKTVEPAVSETLAEPEETAVIVAPKKVPYFPWQRAFSDIERAKQKFAEKQAKAVEDEERRIKEFEAQQRKVQKQMDIRKVEQGRVRKDPAAPIYSEGIAQKYINSADIQLKEFSPAEQAEAEAVSLVVKKHQRVFAVLFHNYSGTGFERRTRNVSSDFDWLALRKEKVNEAEYVKLLTDYGVIPQLLTKEELKALMKTFCYKVLKQADQHYVLYDAFKDLFCQIAWFAFSKPTTDYSHLPPVFAVKSLLAHMRQFVKDKKESTDLFDEADAGTGDKDVVRKLTAELKTDPNTPMPEGYKRVLDYDMQLEYFLPVTLGIPDKHRICYEILDSIMYEKLGIRLLEPHLKVIKQYRAKGVKPPKEIKELPPIHLRANERKFKSTSPVSPPPKGLSVSTRAAKLSPTLKMLVAKSTPQDRNRSEECALILEQLLTKVGFLLAIKGHTSSTSEEKYELRKEREQFQFERKVELDKRKLARRQQHLKEVLTKAKSEREQKLKAEADRRQSLQAKEEAQQKMLAERRRKEKQLKKKILKEYHLKKTQETETQQAEDLSPEDKERLKAVKKKNAEKLKQLIKEKEQQHKQATPEGKAKDMQKARMKRMTTKVLEVARQGSLKESEAKAELTEVLQSEKAQSLFAANKPYIEQVFQYFCRQRIDNAGFDSNTLDFDTFNKAVLQFNLSPGLFNVEATKRIFNMLTKHKSFDESGKLSVSRAEFDQALVYFAQISKNTLHSLNDDSSEKFTADTLDYLFKFLDLKRASKMLTNKVKRVAPKRTITKRADPVPEVEEESVDSFEMPELYASTVKESISPARAPLKSK